MYNRAIITMRLHEVVPDDVLVILFPFFTGTLPVIEAGGRGTTKIGGGE